MEEKMGKFFCPKCNRPVKLKRSPKLDSLTLFRSREEDNIKKFIFKAYSVSYGYSWIGDFFHSYCELEKCWQETGGFTEQEIDCMSKDQWECCSCKYKSKTLATFLYQVQIVHSEENNTLKMLEKENIILNEKINLMMNDLKEIKSKFPEAKNETSTPK